MQINSTNIPATMDERGTYRWQAEIQGRNGLGIDVESNLGTVTWTWGELSKTEYAWWTTTLLGGVAAVAFNQAKLFDHTQTLRTLNYCIVHRPTYGQIRAGAYVDVTVEITHCQ